MANIRVKDIATTAASPASDDYHVIDGTTNGTRKILATTFPRTITGTANQITVTNGDGVAGAPTISLPAAINATAATLTGTLAVGGTGSEITGSGYFRATSGYARTDTTLRNIASFSSNEAAGGAHKLLVAITGGASTGVRRIDLYTGSEGVADGGILAFQAGGGDIELGIAGSVTTMGGVLKAKSYTVAGLPAAASTPYGIVAVSDATNAAGTGGGTAPTGGGAVKRIVYSDGASWLLL